MCYIPFTSCASTGLLFWPQLSVALRVQRAKSGMIKSAIHRTHILRSKCWRSVQPSSLDTVAVRSDDDLLEDTDMAMLDRSIGGLRSENTNFLHTLDQPSAYSITDAGEVPYMWSKYGANVEPHGARRWSDLARRGNILLWACRACPPPPHKHPPHLDSAS